MAWDFGEKYFTKEQSIQKPPEVIHSPWELSTKAGDLSTVPGLSLLGIEALFYLEHLPAQGIVSLDVSSDLLIAVDHGAVILAT